MMNEEQLKARRVQLVNRVNELVEKIPAFQREESALRGQIQLISEMLGEVPAPPGAVVVGDEDPEGVDVTPKKGAPDAKS